jgi:DNA primase
MVTPDPMEFAQHLKAQVDIANVVTEYVRLRRIGNRLTGLCPFHNEKTPSFSVYADKQFYKCYGCDASGDVISFVMTIEGLTFWEAVKRLAEQNGIPLPKQSSATDDATKLRAAIYEMHEIALDHFRENLAGKAGESTRAYIRKRGVTDESVRHFGIGLAEQGSRLTKILESRRFSREQMEASGLVGRRDDGSLYDRFRNRLMFPIHSETGKIIAFGGRALDPEDKAKYMNSPETGIYKKSQILYNLNRAKKTAMQSDRLVLVEGYMDVVGATQAGVVEAVATCGTALTTEQIRSMKRHTQNLHLNFDPDAAGENAAERSIKLLLDESMRVRIVELEGGLDPDEYVKQHGAEAYQERVSKAKSYFYWMADRARTKFDMREPQGRVDAFQALIPSIQGLASKLERSVVATDLAAYLGVESGLVLEHFRKMAADRVDRGPAPRAQPTTHVTDRILMPLLLADEDVRAALITALRGVSLTGASTPVYELLMTMHGNGEAISFVSVHERLGKAQRALFEAIVLEAANCENTLEDGLACIEAWKQESQQADQRDLKTRIKQAEREGRFEEALRLMALLSTKVGAKS